MRHTGHDSARKLEIVLAPAEPEDLAARIGERIVRLRRRLGWDRVELARRLGVRRERLAKWEQGKCAPPVEMLVRLARTLGVPVGELITGEPAAQGCLTPRQCEDLEALLEAARKVLHEPGSVVLPGGADPGGRR